MAKVSIITAVYNGSTCITECIKSVAQQRYTNTEHLIIDGLSSDNTVGILEEYAKKYEHLKYISEKDKGIYDAMNKGISLATGEWIYFLGADDVLYDENVLGEVLKSDNIDHVDVIYGNTWFRHRKFLHGGPFTFDMFMYKNICHQGIFIRKSVFKLLGNFDIKYPLCADYAFNIKWFADKRIRKKHVDIIIANYNDEGISSVKRDERFFNDLNKLMIRNFGIRRTMRLLIWPLIKKRLARIIGAA